MYTNETRLQVPSAPRSAIHGDATGPRRHAVHTVHALALRAQPLSVLFSKFLVLGFDSVARMYTQSFYESAELDQGQGD